MGEQAAPKPLDQHSWNRPGAVTVTETITSENMNSHLEQITELLAKIPVDADAPLVTEEQLRDIRYIKDTIQQSTGKFKPDDKAADASPAEAPAPAVTPEAGDGRRSRR